MSGDGEQLIRDVWRRWNEGERTLDPETIDPEVEVHSTLAGTVFTGEDGLTKWMAEIDEHFEAWEISLDTVRETRPGTFLVDGSTHARGRGSGMDLEVRASWIVDVEEGRIRRLRNYLGPEAAAAARAELG